jgi:DNA-binding IclR family transcriptional regulator
MMGEQARTTDLLRVIQAEYLEMPGLHLTKPQAQRLWGIDPSTCSALLDTLVAVQFLRRNDRDAYVLSGATR